MLILSMQSYQLFIYLSQDCNISIGKLAHLIFLKEDIYTQVQQRKI